jgi:hypothetical protein
MGQAKDANHGGCGGNSRRRGHGHKSHGRNTLANVTCKTSFKEGVCRDLEGHIFRIGPGNKGIDGDMLVPQKENMATDIRTEKIRP